jgi:uncharacterized protein (TIGR03437 family)
MNWGLFAQDYTPRLDFGARLEPQGALMHGAGQSSDAFLAYWNTMPAARRPLVYMHYISLRNLSPNWADELKTTLLGYRDAFVIPHVGLAMTASPSDHYEQQVASGDYDQQIDNLVEGFRRLALPVYLRIGFEFNGLTWNGYRPAPYKQAFIRMTGKLRAANLEVATVWDASVDGVKNYFDYYPGDDYVDWFGMNIFRAASFNDASLTGFFNEARTRRKPVMIGETSPYQVGAQGGAASWNGWFVPFFDFLRNNAVVKQFNYINWEWAYWSRQTGQDWWDWGDARLETEAAAYVRVRYIDQVTDRVMLHAASETDFRRRLGYNDSTAPASVRDLRVTASPGGTTLAWTPVTDPSGIARYLIYRNNTRLNFTLAPPFLDRTAVLGTSAYTVSAIDRAGNVSPLSDPLVVTLDKIERLANGNFEAGLTEWRFEVFDTGAAGSVVTDSANPIAGARSARLSVSRSTGTVWHLQLRQFFDMTEGRSYTFRFKARASAPVSLAIVAQGVAAPYTSYFGRPVGLTTAPNGFEYSFRAPATETVAAACYFGNIGAAAVWLDDISMEEWDPAQALTPRVSDGGIISAAGWQPGIVAGSWVAIKGAHLSPVASQTWDGAIVNGRLPTSLGGVSVRIGNKQAFVYFISPAQVNVIAPDLDPGPTSVTVTTPAGVSAPVASIVLLYSPAFFIWPGSQVVATRQDGRLAVRDGTFPGATTVAAKPGDVLILWGTGFGRTNPVVELGVLVPAGTQYNCAPVTVKLGPADPLVFGCALSPGFAGLYQVAIQVPSSLSDVDYPLKVTVGGASSPDGVVLSVKQ